MCNAVVFTQSALVCVQQLPRNVSTVSGLPRAGMRLIQRRMTDAGAVSIRSFAGSR